MDLEATLDELAPRLLRYTLGRTGNAGLAEEAAQEALVALVQRWRRLGPPESPEAFAFAVARRRAGSALMRRRLFAPLAALADGHHPDPDPETLAMARADLARALAGLRALPARDREALLLVVAGGVGTAAAAALLRISPSALKMRVLRARRRLAHLLEADHG